MTSYYRPILHSDPHRPDGALTLAGGWLWFTHVEVLERGQGGRLVLAQDVPAAVRDRLTTPRADVAGLALDTPRIMGILNVTPDSFSDGGLFDDPAAALAHARAMEAVGADILDIGGESTRPGAAEVCVDDEVARTAPVIAAIRAGSAVPISIDTRKAPVAQAAIAAGASMVNDVAAFTYDPALADVTAKAQVPVCLMHAQGDPETMQADPRYDDVLLDVYDFLEARIAMAEAAGIARNQIIIDPGIGFGKTLQHNVTLLRGLSLYHSLGCAILLGASRKRFIGTLGHAPDAQDRVAGSVAVALHGVAQGVQILRVHDTKETRQALNLHMAMSGQASDG
ncbi:dihydropteroate synthase [Octadecabacter sp. R77987]|uniref:dihydropteroate synthase n=1 Tax=Octadecabacter sp. R77987 TaxID=3093874 RepID=UPI00366E6734